MSMRFSLSLVLFDFQMDILESDEINFNGYICAEL